MEKIKVIIQSDGKAIQKNEKTNPKMGKRHINYLEILNNKKYAIEGDWIPRYLVHNDGFFSWYSEKKLMIGHEYPAEIINENQVRIL